jgi:dTDP-4-dehydrorhamnose reductase
MGPSMPRRRILLTGARGQVGFELQRALSVIGEVSAHGRERLDLADHARLREAMRAEKPTIVVNAAAYTAVDRAETEAPIARAVNALAVAVLAEEAAALGAPVVHLSTDYVFSGSSDVPYREDDPTGPRCVYGATKLEGEALLRATGARGLCVRTSWVYAERGHNFVRTMLRLAREGKPLRVVDDQVGSPTWARALAEAIAVAIARGAFTERVETFHLAGAGRCSWFEFAQEIFARAGVDANVEPIATAAFPTPAKRPAFSVLDCDRAERELGVRLPDWRESLRMADLNRIVEA